MGKLLSEIPAGTEPKACRGCGAQIYWIITPNGKDMPVNADGISHFATCPDAAKFRKQLKAGQG
jgi:hypothetical protein